MAYTKAVISAVIAALVLGVATGAGALFKHALAAIPAEDRATIYAMSISDAMRRSPRASKRGTVPGDAGPRGGAAQAPPQHAAACGKLTENPIARVKLLRVPNVRRVVLDEEAFQRLHSAAERWLKPILLVAFDTGMRKSEVLNLRWSQVDLRAGAVRLGAEDTKTNEPRVVYLTDRVLQTLSEQPRLLHAD
jgi:integrase